MHVTSGPIARPALLSLLLWLAACGGAPAEQAPAPAPVEPPAPAPAPAEPPAEAPAEATPTPAPEAPTAEAQPAPAEAPAPGAAPGAPTAAKGAKTAAASPAEEVKAAPSAQAPKACGEEGQPRCPLQAFMEDEIDKPLESGDLEHVASALAKVAKMAPDPSWNANGAQGFRGMAEAGAAAARANDVPTLQQTCKSCHKAFRRKYKEEFRPRPLP